MARSWLTSPDKIGDGLGSRVTNREDNAAATIKAFGIYRHHFKAIP